MNYVIKKSGAITSSCVCNELVFCTDFFKSPEIVISSKLSIENGTRRVFFRHLQYMYIEKKDTSSFNRFSEFA